MSKINQLWAQFQQKLWQRMSRQNQRRCQIILGLTLLAITVRSLPYLAPIRATDIVQDEQALSFSDRNGLPLGTILTRDQNHTAVVPLSQVSPYFIQAIIAAEDRRFYQHGALDMQAFARAIIEAIQARKIISGASTITMQLARMLEPAPRTLPNKLKEIWLSWRITAGMSKDDILQAYINRLPMGGNIYGVEAAARIYFGIPASELNLAQASLLAAIPNAPTYFNPYYLWHPLKKRQKYVLARMVKDGYITQTQAERAYAEEISLQPPNQGIIAAPHFLFWLANQLPPQHPHHIRTTIERELQQFVEAQVQQVIRSLWKNNARHAAALVIDNHTGEILAYVGSPDYFDHAQMGRNDGVQALRQPGSTLKPFLYELALEKRLIRPNSILADVPTHYAIPGAKLYSPIDYSEKFLGPVRVRIALANSLNVPAVRVLEKLGVDNFLERLRELGFEHLNQSPEYYGLGLTLGSGEVSLWELARAYFIIARRGEIVPLVAKFSDNAERNQGYKDNQFHRIGSAATWMLITDILSERHARAHAFGVESVLSLPFPAAVKTGTSSYFRDTWAVGFTTDYTVATWVGNFNGEPMQKVSGVTGAASLWNRIMLHLHEKREPAAFPPPENLVQRPICAVTGLPPTPDCTAVVSEYFYPEDIRDYEAAAAAHKSQLLNLPREYDAWLSLQQQPIFANQSLKIVFPKNDAYFLLNPGEPSRLQFKIVGASAPVEWRLNGKKLAVQSSNSLFWHMAPGEWRLEVKSGEMTDSVSFQVQIEERKTKPRGFSIAEQKKAQKKP
ncbi:MAG TPA: penicillin-binding protein 1C [Oscillatoriaceae cyanobacterium M7585_C2015_266]|nr:penicillin-binding protein 1C [Oscillatoriaceae cyanobacterium M7585_C2015_266]